jgi:hypothetical protein
MNSPFVDVSVMPMYGALKARIMWKVQPGFDRGNLFVSKSCDGINNWHQLGETTTKSGEFIDTKLIARGRWDEAYYKVEIQQNGQRYTSDVISTFGKITRSEFAIARVIMQHEWETLRQFTPIKFFKLRSDGERCTNCMDEDTGQKVGTSLCKVCYGTGFEGGYYPALDSYMHIGQISSKIQDASREGVGASDPVTIRVRMMSYPMMENSDLIVSPLSDKRYLIDTLDYGFFNGKVPVHAEVQLQLLARNDIRYTLPL